MTYRSINPFDGSVLGQFAAWNAGRVEHALAEAAAATYGWSATPIGERCALLLRLGEVVRARRDSLAALITAEMGKRISESCAEVDKCALACDYYAEHAPSFLADEIIESDAGKSLVAYRPLGTILAVMPWNFPLWQVFRFLVPALAAGNTGLLKHASNVPQCALAVEELVRAAGFPAGVFRTLLIESERVSDVIADPRVHAVTLTGSEPAGRAVAACAGRNLKKSVLELGGSDAFVVLEDADLELTVAGAMTSRFLNAGQSCIAAKRFIVVEAVADTFVQRFARAMTELQAGDPANEQTTLAPLARPDLRDELHRQVHESVAAGARLVMGGESPTGPSTFYPATLLDHVQPGMPAFDEELFGPVAAVIRVADETQALIQANNSRYGLGGSVWTRDSARGERFARKLQSGAAFVNGIVKSDPRLPFGGIKASGYGRELSLPGIREFVNTKTIWIR